MFLLNSVLTFRSSASLREDVRVRVHVPGLVLHLCTLSRWSRVIVRQPPFQ